MLAIDCLVPNPWNKARMKRASKESLKELAASIEKVGVLQPILVRAIPSTLGTTEPKYEIVAGERRWRAAKAAGLKEVPITTRDLTDVEVVEVLAIENGQREDTHPLEDAAHYAFLLENGQGYDVAAIAAKVGKSKTHVYQRLKLAELVPEAKAAFEDGKLTIGHAILIARLQPKEQLAVIKWMNLDMDWGRATSIQELKDRIEYEIYLDLKGAPFDVNIEDLAKSVPCALCPKRSGYAPDLFPELAKRDVCTDPACFRAKTQAHIAKTVNQHEAKGVELTRISGDYGRTKKNVVSRNDWREAKKSDPGAKPAIVVQGPDTGKVKYVKVRKPPPEPAKRSARASTADNERSMDMQREIITERAQEFAELVKAIAEWIGLEDEIALFFATSFDPNYMGWPGAGGRRSREQISQWAEELEDAVVPLLPGKWNGGSPVWGAHRPADGEAARHKLAFEVWLARDTGDLDKEVKREAKGRIKAKQKQSTPTPAKRKRTKQAT